MDEGALAQPTSEVGEIAHDSAGYRVAENGGHEVPHGEAGSSPGASHEEQFEALRQDLAYYKSQADVQKKTAAELVSLKLDAVQRDLEKRVRDVSQQLFADVAQKAGAAGAAAAQMVTREVLHSEVDSLHSGLLRLSTTVDERLGLFEERLDAMEQRQSKAREHAGATASDISTMSHRLDTLSDEFREVQSLMAEASPGKKQDGQIDAFFLDEKSAQATKVLVEGWGHGKFSSQQQLIAWIESKLGIINMEVSELAPSNMVHGLESKLAQEVEKLRIELSEKLVPVELKMDSTESMIRSLVAKAEGPRALDTATFELGKLHEEVQALQQAQEEALHEVHAKKDLLQDDLNHVALALTAAAHGKKPDDFEDDSSCGSDAEALKPWLSKRIRQLAAKANAADFSQEPSREDLVAWMRDEMSSLVQGVTPGRRQSHDLGLSAVDPAHPDAIADLQSREWGKEANDLQRRVSVLERGFLSSNLEDRVSALEQNFRTPAAPEGPAPGDRGRTRPSRPSTAAGGGRDSGSTHIMAMRDELHRLRGRVTELEQRVEKGHGGKSPGQDDALAQVTAQLDQCRQDLQQSQQDHSDGSRRELDNLTRAVRGNQRAIDLTASKLEDLAGHFSKLHSRFEAALPQLLLLVTGLARRGGGGTGDTQGIDFSGEVTDNSPELDALASIKNLLFGGIDGSGMPFVSPSALQEALDAFEANFQNQLGTQFKEVLRSMSMKAEIDKFEAVAKQVQQMSQQLHALGQGVFKVMANQNTPSDNAAIFRIPLTGRCVSCDKKVDVKTTGGLWGPDLDHFGGAGLISPSPRERVSSANRNAGGRHVRREQPLPAIDADGAHYAMH
eukprot:gb/GFBE01071855.1/.p1 GENE.gb/GFBE01071855.1/~~gb/GFBE01071855.1/.p1  ORF type:complete len:844 (+),score=181.09 gb/GFBE01071855.1/:1-2532(+)